MKKFSRRRQVDQNSTKRIILNVAKIIVITYIFTAIMLVLLAFMMNKLDLGDKEINIGIIVVIVASTFLGGFLIGKTIKEKRWMYGVIVGAVYFVILVVLSLLINEESQIANDAITLLIMCLGGGTLGGMLS